MAANNSNDPLWFAHYDEYLHDQELAKPEGREASGFKIEVPADVIANLYKDDPRYDPDQEFYQTFSWYQVPLEIHSPSGWRTNPAALAPPPPDSIEESVRQKDVYHEVPVSHLSVQTVEGPPFVELPTSKRGVAGIYYCVRQREKDPDGYRATDRRNYVPVARIKVVINNVQSEVYALDGQSLVLAAPVTLPLLRESEVYYRWVLCHYPSSSDLAQALNGINAGVKSIRDKILTGDLNPHSAYFNIPAQKREVSLILAGYDMDAEGKVPVQTPLPDLQEYSDLIDVTLRLLRGYRARLTHSASSEDIASFVEHLHEDLVRLFTGDAIFRNITLQARQRVLTIASVSSIGHQGLFRCQSLARAAVGEEFAVRKLLPDLPEGYGLSWIPTASIRLHVLDANSANRKLGEVNSFAYSRIGTRLPSVQIIDVNPEDAKAEPKIELHDAPSQYSRAGEASIAWHVEVIPSSYARQHLSVLPRPETRTPRDETSFIRELVAALNSMDADSSSPRYSFGHRVTHSEADPEVVNIGDKYQLPISADVFKQYNKDLVQTITPSLKRLQIDDDTIEQLKNPGGYTLVVAAFLDNPGVNGTVFETEDLTSTEGDLVETYHNALLFRILDHRAEKLGLNRENLFRSRGIRNYYEGVFRGCAKDFELAEKRYSGNEKPLLGMFVIQYDLDQETRERTLKMAAARQAQERIEAELRDQGSRARELIEANIAQYEQSIKVLLENRKAAAKYVDWIFMNRIRHMQPLEEWRPFEFERALRRVFADARQERTHLLMRYRVRPVRYGPASNPRNQAGYDAIWYHDQEAVMLAPLACGEGVPLFPPTADLGTTFTEEGIDWLVRCWLEYTTITEDSKKSSRKFVLSELFKRPDDIVSDEVVRFLGDYSNNQAFAGIVSVTLARNAVAAQRMSYEDFHTVITTLTDINGIRQVIDPSNEPLTRFIEALRTVPVEDDDFSSKRYRRLLVSVLTTKLARLASILNLVNFQTSESIGYRGAEEELNKDAQLLVTDDERAERLMRKQLLLFDPQLYVSKATVPTLSLAISRLLDTEGYSGKLSDADKSFLQEFFRVPEPPRNLTQLDDTPVIVRLPNQGDDQIPDQERPAASGPDQVVVVDLGGNRGEIRNIPEFDEDTENEPATPTRRRRVPGLDEDESESEAPSAGSTPGPSPGQGRTPFDTSLVTDLIGRLNGLEIAENQRVGASRYLRPVDEYEEAKNNPFRRGVPAPSSENLVLLTGPNSYGLTKGRLDEIVLETMRSTRQYLNQVIERLYGVLGTNRQALTELGSLVYPSAEDRRVVEGLYGHLIQMYDRSLMEVKEIIRDGFEANTVFDRPSFSTNRVENEIRKETLRRLRGNPSVNEALVRTTAEDVAARVYANIATELRNVDTRLVLPDERYKSQMRSFHFYVDEEAAFKTLVKSLVVLPQYWDDSVHTKSAPEIEKRGARAKLGFHTLASSIVKFTGIDEEVSSLDTLLRTAPTSLSVLTSTQLRAAVEALRGENAKLKPSIIQLREDLETALLRARQRVFDELYKQIGPNSPPDQSGKQGLTVVALIRRLREEIYRTFIMEDRRVDFESVSKQFDLLSGQAASARKTVEQWKERVRAEVRAASAKPPAAPATPAVKQQPALRGKLETFRREHEEFVAKMGLRGKSSEVAQRKLAELYSAADNALSHPRPEDTADSLTNLFSAFCYDYVEAFWTDRPVVVTLAEKVTSSQEFEAAFMAARDSVGTSVPGTYYLGTSLRLFEEGKEQTIRMIAEEFTRGIRRALAIPTWTIRPNNADAAPSLADADRRNRAAKLEDLETRSFQALLQLLRDLSSVRVKTAESFIRNGMTTEILGLSRNAPLPAFSILADRLNDIPRIYPMRIDRSDLWRKILDLWSQIIDLVTDASVRSHEHLLPWLKDVRNVKISVQQNPRLSGVCALENFCYISDKALLKNVFALANQFLTLERERTEAVLTKGLASAIQAEKPGAAEEESQAFLALMKEVSRDLDAGRLPLSDLVARMYPANAFSGSESNTIRDQILDVLADRSLRPSGRQRNKAATAEDWQNETRVLCIATRAVMVDALLAARTEVAAQRLIPGYTQAYAGTENTETAKIILTVNSTINSLAALEFALSSPKSLHANVEYILSANPDPSAEQRLYTDAQAQGERPTAEIHQLYIKSIRAYMQKTGLKRLVNAATSVAPHLSEATEEVKAQFARNLGRAFGGFAITCYASIAQDSIQRSEQAGVDFQSSDLSETFVRRALELLNVLPSSQHSVLLTGEDLLRFFAPDQMDRDAYAKFVDTHLLCGSSRFLYIEEGDATWSVAARSEDRTSWNQIFSNSVSTDSLVKPSSTASFTVAPRAGPGSNVPMREFVGYLLSTADKSSKSNIKRPAPSILINGSLLLDMMRKLDELRTTSTIGSNQKVLVRQLGFVQPLPPITESRPSDQQPGKVPSSPEELELMDSGSVVPAPAVAVPKAFSVPSTPSSSSSSQTSPNNSAKAAADAVLLLSRVREGREEVQRSIDAWTELYQRFSSQLTTAIKGTTDSVLEEPRRGQLQATLALVLNGFSEKSSQVRKALADRLEATNKYSNLLSDIQSGDLQRARTSTFEDLKDVEQKELRDMRDAITASTVRLQEIERGLSVWIAKAASAINSKFATSSALQAALQRGRQLDNAVLAGVQSAGASSS